MKHFNSRIKKKSYALLGQFLAFPGPRLCDLAGVDIVDLTKPNELPVFHPIVLLESGCCFRTALDILSEAEKIFTSLTTKASRKFEFRMTFNKYHQVKNRKMFLELIKSFIDYWGRGFLIIAY